jgi:hypothetical protein
VNATTREQRRLTTDAAGDGLPDWQPLVN